MREDQLQAAIRAIKAGHRQRARELLSELLKGDPKRARYWLWMSAAVDSPKESIYCLETALKLEPDNKLALGGLRFFGRLAPAEEPAPISPGRARSWEQRILAGYGMTGPSGIV